MGAFIAATAREKLKDLRANLRSAERRYATLQHPESEYGQDIAAYIATSKQIEAIWLGLLPEAERDTGGGV